MRRSTVVILIILIIIVDVVTFIFCNSLEEQKKSAEKSEGLLKYIIEIMDIEDEPETIEKVHKTVRKIAHGVEFTVLGVLLGILSRKLEKRNGRKYICFPLFVGLLVGVTDEFLQTFGNRSGEVGDVLIDFGGIVAGVGATMLIFYIIDKKVRHRNRSDYE